MTSVKLKRLRASLLPFVALAAISTPALAQRQQAVGPGVIPLNATGVLNGVDLSASGTTGTLNVGVVGGPATDVFTANNPFVAGRVAISTAASSQGNIAFNSGSTVFGDIGVTQPGGPFLLAITGGNTGTVVNFRGNVYATTTNVLGTGRLNFNSGSTNISATNFGGDGTISLAPNSRLIGALTTTAGANTGTLELGGGSVLNGAVGGAIGLRAINVVGGSNLAGVSATITGATNAFTFSLGTNTLNIGGALTIANGGPSGVINTTLASTSVFGNIRPVGATNLGSTLLINVTVPNTTFLAVGSQFNIVQTAPGTLQSGTNGTVLTVTIQNPTNPLYSFRPVPLAGTIAGLVTIETTATPVQSALTPPPGAVVPPTQPIAAIVVPVLLAAPPTSDLATVLAAINAFSDPAAVVSAVAQLAPSPSTLVAPLVAFHANRQLQNLWMSRFDCGPLGRREANADRALEKKDTCISDDQRVGWWINGFGYFAEQDAQRSFVGYKAKTGGVMAGVDAPLGPDTHFGLGFGYARSGIRAKGKGSRADVDTIQMTAYVGHEPGPWFVNGALSVGVNFYSGSRRIAFPGVDRKASATFGGDSYTAIANTGLHLCAGGLTFTPTASIQAMRVNVDGYVETGAGDISLRVRSRKYDFVESGLGLKIAKSFAVAGGTFEPELHGRWLHELSNPNLSQTASFSVAGSQFLTTPELSNAKNTYNVGGALNYFAASGDNNIWAIGAGYDFYGARDGYSAHQATVKVTGRF